MKINTEPIIKSRNDKREYLSGKLENELEVLVVEDKNSDKSAVSLTVEVGSLADPKDYNGLAHLLEHMLFLGTAKYPDPSDYKAFLASHGGTANACTTETQTTFYFTVQHLALQPALDRFTQFFIAPLMTPDLLSRELQAVHSEHTKNINLDNRREARLLKYLSDPASVFNSFTTGNLSTLQKEGIREQVISFYKQHYSSNLMKVCIVSNQPPKDTIQLANDLLSAIPNHHLSTPLYSPSGYANTHYQASLVQVIPITTHHRLKLFFSFEYTFNQQYQGNPSRYLSSLLGHEGQNSLLYILKQEGLVLELSAGGSDRMGCFHLFCVSMRLTEQGLKEWKRVVGVVLQYIHMLKQKGVQSWYFQELATVSQLAFDFKSDEKPQSYAVDLSSAMHLYPIHHLLIRHALWKHFDQEAIHSMLNNMNLNNANIYLISQSLNKKQNKQENKQENSQLNEQEDQQLDQQFEKEEYYGIEYKVSKIDEELIKELSIKDDKIANQLDLPVKNTFIAECVDLLESEGLESDYPREYKSNDRMQVFYLQDKQFLVPKGCIYIKLYCPPQMTAKQRVFYSLWLDVVKQSLNPTGYLAQQAKMYADITVAASGVQLVCQGFNHKLYQLVQVYLQGLHINTLHQQHIANSLYKIQQNHNNFTKNQSYQIAAHFLSALLLVNGDTDFLALRQASQSYCVQHFQQAIPNWLQQIRATVFITGNLSTSSALQITTLLDTFLTQKQILSKQHICEIRTIQLNTQKYFYEWLHEDPCEQNSAIIQCYQLATDQTTELLTQMLVAVTIQAFKAHNFQQLRTIEQLGYTVFTHSLLLRGVTHFQVTLQSNVQGPHYLATRIQQALLTNYQQALLFTQQQVEQYKQAVITMLKQQPYSLYEQANKHWAEINTHQYLFDRNQQSIHICQSITKESLITFIEQNIIHQNNVIEVMVTSHHHLQQDKVYKQKRIHEHNMIEIPNIKWFQRRMSTYPDFYQCK